MNSLLYKDVPNELTKRLPEFQDHYDEHLRDNGQVLLHVLFGDLVRFVYDVFSKQANLKSINAENILRRIFAFIEDLSDSSDPVVRDLVVASFMPNLDEEHPSFPNFRALMGPKSRQLFRTSRDG